MQEMTTTMNTTDKQIIRQTVRERYGRIADQGGSCCASPGCGSGNRDVLGLEPKLASRAAGYRDEELSAVPAGANLGLGCGNPQAIASLRPGETVLDLGSGGGLDAFLAAQAVGETGRVIGVDMTPEMIAKAGENAERAGFTQVEFRLGEIEALPVAGDSVDVIMSNCVINLSPDKQRVFTEAFRVLKPGGRLAISDVVALSPIPAGLKQDWELYTGCVAGASTVDQIQAMLQTAGFSEVRITLKGESRDIVDGWFPGQDLARNVGSASIQAVKPRHDS